MSGAFDIASVRKEDVDAKVTCAECGHEAHSLFGHASEKHGLSAEQYQAKHPGSDMVSPFGRKVFEQQMKGQSPTTNYQPKDVSSLEAFKIGFGKNEDVDKPVKGYEGFTDADGLPPIDPHYLFPTDVTRDVLMGFAGGAKVYAVGPTGSGKTTLFEQIAARVGRPFWRQQFHQEMEPVELLGTWTVGANGEMVYLYSGLAQALQVPSIVCFDEFDSGNAGVSAIANALLEGKPLVLSNKGGEKIYPHPDCILTATGNTNGMGDETGLYASTSQQSYATMNRYSLSVKVDYMKAEDEIVLMKSIYQDNNMPEQEIKDMVKVAGLLREGYVGNKITVPMSTRQVIFWGKWLAMSGNPKRSFALSFANQLGTVDSGVAYEIYQRVFGGR